MARYQVTLAYDGTNFLGFQRQGSVRTVQKEFETALKPLGWQEQAVLAAGRTDTGVHALGQVVAFNLDWAHSTEALGRALNARLPQDIAVRAVKIAAVDFHPRYDARARTYKYYLLCDPDRNPLRERYAWRIWPEIEFELLQQASAVFIGSHDFAAFGTPPRPGRSTVRNVIRSQWAAGSDGYQYEITANAFLYHQVRRTVFVQVLAARSHLRVDAIADAIQTGQSLPPGLAPSQGLFLERVQYSLIEQENVERYLAAGDSA